MINLDSTQKQLIFNNLDENGELSCIKAFKAAKMMGIKPKHMAKITKGLDIKITNCELGVFGKLQFTNKNDAIYNKLSKNSKSNKKVQCEIAWKLAQEKGSTLKKVGASIKNSDLKVTHCQLGCFYDEEFEEFEKVRENTTFN